MNLLKLIPLIALVTISCAHAAGQAKHLFICSGQSNMGRLDLNISFTPALEKAFGKNNVTVVKDAQGNQSIHRWYKKWKPTEKDKPKTIGDLYDRLMTKVKAAAKGKRFTTITFVWMQGERDAQNGNSSVYAASLNGLLAQLRTDLKRKDLNIVIGRLNDANGNPHWKTIRKAQETIASSTPRGAWINTDDLNDGVNKNGRMSKRDVHATPEGYKIMGQRFAEKAIALIKK